MSAAVQFEQVQGLVRFGYRTLTECSFLLLTIRDVEAAKRWLQDAPVSSAVALNRPPATALQVAFTPHGLVRLGLSQNVLSQFSLEFQSGLAANAARSRLLGDTGQSAPAEWSWGADPSSLHVLVMLYALPGRLADWRRQLLTAEWETAFELTQELATSSLEGVEPFGFPDGVSQPAVDWDRQRTPPTIEDEYTNAIMLGEFLLGYPNEYNRYTDRPLLATDAPHADCLPQAEDQPGLRDFGRNGCYLVLRTLEQDVDGFHEYIAENAGDTPGAQDRLASAMVGRQRDGTPLAPLCSESLPGVAETDLQNRFTFNGDPAGTQCPFGAHVRRANPRNGDMPAPKTTGLHRLLALVGLQRQTLQADAKASSRFHRIMRRGREYGTAQAPAASSAASSGREPAGIHFICLVANIARQFEFLQSAWLMSTKFDGMTGESDPLLGSREPLSDGSATNTFSMPTVEGPAVGMAGLPRFVHVRGGAYFFLPSLPTIRYLAALSA